MAKDDYYVIVCKILVYLYNRLKGRDNRDPMVFLNPTPKDFPISQSYFDYCIRHMYKKGYIEGVAVQANGDEIYGVYVTEKIQITPEGIDFMQDNSKIRRAMELLPEAAGLIASFV